MLSLPSELKALEVAVCTCCYTQPEKCASSGLNELRVAGLEGLGSAVFKASSCRSNVSVQTGQVQKEAAFHPPSNGS